MNTLLSQVVGCDVAEFRRVSRFARMFFDPDTFMYANEVDVYSIIGLTDEDDPVFDLPWYKATSKHKRRKYLHKHSSIPSSVRIRNVLDVPNPAEFIVALYEDEIQFIFDEAAIIIQRHVRGVLTRIAKGVHNPHCLIGHRFLLNRFNSFV